MVACRMQVIGIDIKHNLLFEMGNQKLPDIKNTPGPSFGVDFTSHMIRMDFTKAQGWSLPQIIPYSGINFQPSLISLHYGQMVFEGIKAFRENNNIYLIRPQDHLNRLNFSAKKLCIPQIPVDSVFEKLIELLRADEDKIPELSNGAIYIRPFIFANEHSIGLKNSDHYCFLIILTPISHSYYGDQVSGINVFVNTGYARSTYNGNGNIKSALNYAVTLEAREKAFKRNCQQVLWLDPVQLEYVQEFDTMNFFVKTTDSLITPPINNNILNGFTRDTIIKIADGQNIPVNQKIISIKELVSDIGNGKVEAVFGSGTAMGIVPVNTIIYNDINYRLNNNNSSFCDNLSKKLQDVYMRKHNKFESLTCLINL